MARRTDFNGATQAIAATTAQTLTWTNTQIPSDRVVAYHVTLQGADNDLTALERIRVFANGSPIVNVSVDQLLAYWQSFSVGAAIKYPTSARVLTIPFCLLDAPQPELQDVSQFPDRSSVQIQLVFNATTSAGVAWLGWTQTDIEPVVFPRLLGSTMNIPASVTNSRFAFQENGVVRGLWMPSAGISRARLVLGNEQWALASGAQYQALANLGDMFFEMEALYGNGVASSGTPLTTSAFHRMTARVAAPVNGSFVELDTGAGWAGVANELCTYAIAENGPQG